MKDHHYTPMPVDQRLEKYLARRAVSAPWCISGSMVSGFSGVVVIPALAESANLQATLDSLSKNRDELLQRFLVLVVVNHREDADIQDKADNLLTLEMLPKMSNSLPINLAWVDAASPGLELPLRDGGVGMARKIGFDLALPRLAWNGAEPILVSLDADTLVDPDYLFAIVEHFRRTTAGGAVIPFCHREPQTLHEQDIISRYELFLRAYILGLSYAVSPYAFHSVGSAMVCTASAYIRSGGMNSRRAGEDFYFLQHLKKTAGIDQVSGTIVYPSPRPSHRVPFGTGRSVSRALAEEEGAISFYRPETYHLLKEWLSLSADSFGCPGEVVMKRAERISPMLSGYLEGERFVETWERISKVKRTNEAFAAAFHEWFDGLKTMKLIHYFAAESFPRCTAEEALPPLLEMAGLKPVVGVKAQLELLRSVQNENT